MTGEVSRREPSRAALLCVSLAEGYAGKGIAIPQRINQIWYDRDVIASDNLRKQGSYCVLRIAYLLRQSLRSCRVKRHPYEVRNTQYEPSPQLQTVFIDQIPVGLVAAAFVFFDEAFDGLEELRAGVAGDGLWMA